jgi:hypothetical protein
MNNTEQMRKLLEAADKFAGQAVGQQPGDQVRGTDQAATNSNRHPFLKKLVGEADQLEKQNIEEELAEAWSQFKEASLGLEPKRPSRTGSREEKYGPRGHTAQPRYRSIKEYTPPAGAAPAAAGTTAPVKPGAATADPAAAAAIQKSLSTLKTSVPGLDVTKASTTLAKADTGTQLNPTDQAIVGAMAPQLANVVKNPAMAGQLKMMIDKAGKLDMAQAKKQQGLA